MRTLASGSRAATTGSPAPQGASSRAGGSAPHRIPAETEPVPSIVHEVLRSPGQRLDEGTRTFMGERLGHDFSQVRVHADTRASESARAIGARAYTVGRDIVFDAPSYLPSTEAGRRLLAHELTHVLQQEGASAGPGLKLGPLEDRFEREAMAASRHLQPTPISARAERVVARDAAVDGSFLDFTPRHQAVYSFLNGLEIHHLVATARVLEDMGYLPILLGNLQRATGINRSRLLVVLTLAGDRGKHREDELRKALEADLANIPDDQVKALFNLFTFTPLTTLTVPPSSSMPDVTLVKQIADTVFLPPVKLVEDAVNLMDKESPGDSTQVSQDEAVNVGMVPAKPHTLEATKKATLIEESDKAKTLRVEETPAVYVKNILTNAGFDYDTWLKDFVDTSFLGVSISPSIHKEFAAILKQLEQRFADLYGGPSKSPAEAGKYLGVRTIGGSRSFPTCAALSSHLFGLAIDVNYTANPYISESSSNLVFPRAGILVNGAEMSLTLSSSFDELKKLNSALVSYFALSDDPKLEENPNLRRFIERYASDVKAPLSKKKKLSEAERKIVDDAEALTKETALGVLAEAAKKIIESDLQFLAGRWERGSNVEVIKKGGFFDFSKEFVDGMTQGTGLDWGGGSYGDMMHFDWRNSGTGAKVQRAITAYKKEKKAEAETAYSEESEEARKARREAEKAAKKQAAEEAKAKAKAEAEAKAQARAEAKAKAKAEAEAKKQGGAKKK
ncbi:DUF4157 domain-containing protein [Archangium minus]